MRKKKMKSTLSVVLVAVLVVLCFSENVFAKTYGEETKTGKYVYVGYKQLGNLTFWTYKNNNNWIAFYPGKKLTPVVHHVVNTGDDTLTFAYSVTQSKTKTSSWSANGNISKSLSENLLDLFEKAISVSVGLGCGESYAREYSYTSSGQVTKVIKNSAPTGYYVRVPGYTFYKMEVRVLRANDYTLLNKFYFDEPYGSAVIYTIYSKSNSNWSIYK